MSIHPNIGGIGKASEVSYFEWKIGNFTTMVVESERFGFCESPAFRFASIPWRLELWPKSNTKPDCMALRLFTRCTHPFLVEYNLGMKRLDNSVDQLGTGHLSSSKMYTDGCFMKRSEILQQKCVLVPFDQITIVCTIQLGTISFTKPNPPKLNPNLQLSKIKDFLRDGKFCDVTLNVKNKVFKAHKVILAARSAVFESYFKHDTLENRTGVVNIPDCDPESFKMFLEYLYCGKLESISFHSSLELYKTADKYDVKELQTLCIKGIENNLKVKNFCDIAAFAEERNDANLFVIAQDFFNGNLKEILRSAEWGNLLKSNFTLGSKLLTEMASNIQGVLKPHRLENIDPPSE